MSALLSAPRQPQQPGLSLSSSSPISDSPRLYRTCVGCDHISSRLRVAPSRISFSTLHKGGGHGFNFRNLSLGRLPCKRDFNSHLTSNESDSEMDRRRTSKNWRMYRLMGTAKAGSSPSTGPESNLAMPKSDVDSCIWLSSTEQCSGGSDSGSSVQCSDVFSHSADGASNNQTVGTADLMNRCLGRDFHRSVEGNSSGTDNGRAAAARISAQLLEASSVVTSPGDSVAGYRIADGGVMGNTRSWIHEAESGIERAIFDCRFLSLLAVVGSLAGSLLCFLKGCVYIVESYVAFWKMCLNGLHTGKMVLRLVEAVDVYLVGTVLLIFGMGLYGLFISNVPLGLEPSKDRALRNSSLFGMFMLKNIIWNLNNSELISFHIRKMCSQVGILKDSERQDELMKKMAILKNYCKYSWINFV